MPQAWNPNSPAIVGLEYRKSAAEAAYGVTAPDRMRALRWNALASEQLDSVRLHTGLGTHSDTIEDGLFDPLRHLIVEIVPQASEAAAVPEFTDYVANALTVAGMTDESGGAAALADITTRDDGLYIRSTSLSSNFSVGFGTAGQLNGRQILAVDLHVVCAGSIDANWSVPGATTFDARRPTQHAGDNFTELVWRLPELSLKNGAGATQLLWLRPADVQALDTGNPINFRNRGGPGKELRVDYVFCRVWHIAERRLAVGTAAPGSTPPFTTFENEWMDFPLQNPTRTGSWSKVNGTAYTLFLRRGVPWLDSPHAEATMFWKYLRGNPPFFSFGLRRVSVALNGGLPQPGSTTAVDGTPAIRFRGGGADLAESQPYSNAWALGHFVNDVSQYQLLTAPTAVARDLVYLWLSEPEGAGGYDVSIRSADGVTTHQAVALPDGPELDPFAPTMQAQIMNTATVDGYVDRVSGAPITLRRYRVRLPSGFVPSAATQYRLVPQRTDFDPGVTYYGALVVKGILPPWGPEAANDSQTFGGSTDRLVSQSLDDLFSGNNAHDKGDMLAIWTTLPNPPQAVAASMQTQNLADVADACGKWRCPIETLKFARVTWNAPAGGVSTFFRYDVERHTVYDGWQRIASLYDANPGSVPRQVDDYEARIGIVTKYRVRYVRGDGAESDWVETGTVTLTSEGRELLFTSNVDPTKNLAYVDVDSGGGIPTRGYSLPEADELVLRTVYGRDFAVGFRPAERRGVAFDRTLLINAFATVPAPTNRVFAPLTDTAHADLPYVCVRDTEGNRWLSALNVPEVAGRVGTAQRYFATIGVAEVTRTPYRELGPNTHLIDFIP